MNSLNFEELNIVLDQLCEKRDDLQDQIDTNSLMLLEMDSPSESAIYGEGEDYDLFSPRKKAGTTYKRTKLEKNRSEIQEQNNKLFLERNKINALIDILQRVLKDEQEQMILRDQTAEMKEKEAPQDPVEMLLLEYAQAEVPYSEETPQTEQKAEKDTAKETEEKADRESEEKTKTETDEKADKGSAKGKVELKQKKDLVSGKELSQIAHKIELCKKFIGQDSHRAKQELDNINKKIYKLIDTISCENED